MIINPFIRFNETRLLFSLFADGSIGVEGVIDATRSNKPIPEVKATLSNSPSRINLTTNQSLTVAPTIQRQVSCSSSADLSTTALINELISINQALAEMESLIERLTDQINDARTDDEIDTAINAAKELYQTTQIAIIKNRQ